MAAFLARNYSLKFLCIRQFQNRISDSVYTVLVEKIEAAGWTQEFDIGVSSIKHKTTGSEFLFLRYSTQHLRYKRHRGRLMFAGLRRERG